MRWIEKAENHGRGVGCFRVPRQGLGRRLLTEHCIWTTNID